MGKGKNTRKSVACFSYSSDDINKFLWMVRIGGNTELGAHIKETDYYTPTGEFRVDREGSGTLLNCMMYKMSYYKFGQVYTDGCESVFLVLLFEATLNVTRGCVGDREAD